MSSPQNVLLLAYPGATRWECLCLNSGIRANEGSLLGCIGVMLNVLEVRGQWDVLGGPSSRRGAPYQPAPAETAEFCNVLMRGETDAMDVTGHPGVSIKAVRSLMGTYALWLEVEMPSRLPKPGSTSADSSGGA